MEQNLNTKQLRHPSIDKYEDKALYTLDFRIPNVRVLDKEAFLKYAKQFKIKWDFWFDTNISPRLSGLNSTQFTGKVEFQLKEKDLLEVEENGIYNGIVGFVSFGQTWIEAINPKAIMLSGAPLTEEIKSTIQAIIYEYREELLDFLANHEDMAFLDKEDIKNNFKFVGEFAEVKI